MRDKVVEVLKNSDRALSIEEIDNLLGGETIDDIWDITEELKKLEMESIVYHSNKDKFMLLENSHLKKGIVRTNKKGFGFIEGEGYEDIYVSLENMNGAINGDIVLVEVISKKNLDKIEGRILKIVKRELSTFVGEINFKNEIGYITLDDNKIKLDIEIPKSKNMGAVDGHKVLVKILSMRSKGKYDGEVIEILGHKNDPGVDILSITKKYNINDVFSDLVMEEIDKIPSEVLPDEKVGRRDLTNEEIFTIDGDDTKDIDDAISIKKLPNNNYLLGVHIADVSYYAKENSEIDKEAYDRGTSVYLVDRVVPMLPHQLSNGICSLNPGVERLTITCEMEINDVGKVVDYKIYESFIKSRIQMTYKKVNQIYNNEDVVEYKPYINSLMLMKELSIILGKNKDERGYLDFDVDEAKILVDELGHPLDIVKRDRGIGEKVIEDFMIVANETVATTIFYMELPFIYRIHEYPKEEKIREFLSFLGTMGYHMPGNLKDTNPKSIQGLLKFLNDKPEFKILSSLLLRNMRKAIYGTANLGHYGLASKCYTHFTSPIRRYPDTTVHRLLRTYLFNKDLSHTTIAHWEEKLPLLAEHASGKERASIECEREVEDMKMAEYMENHIGEEFKGMICSVMNFGLFVQLDNLIEGLVHVNEMNDFFVYDENTMSLTGRRTNVVYKIGEEIIVRVLKASKIEKTIDFVIVKKV
ncbi:MAG: ribonuclease R [Bacilli bacterium]